MLTWKVGKNEDPIDYARKKKKDYHTIGLSEIQS